MKKESKKEKTVEEQYQKLEHKEHVLKRPDTYIGSISASEQLLWVLSQDDSRFEERKIQYVPGFLKLFDEILVNASDNFVNSQKDGIIMDTLKVVINEKEGFVSIWNNGKGIPVQIHEKYNIYVAELIFGELLTGSNYDDDEKKITGGRNGYGAKLANIFSQKFIVECGDRKNKKQLKAEWNNNMDKKSKPIIKDYDKSESFTCITYYPDMSKFEIKEWTQDMLALLKKRVYDIAGMYSKKLKVFLNGQRIQIKSYKDYVDMYLSGHTDDIKIYDAEMTTDRWEILVTYSEGVFRQVSFVNSICTIAGGTHVEYIAQKITDELLTSIKNKHKKLDIKPQAIKSNLWVFVNCLIENPSFDSQTKEKLTTQVSKFGSKPNISDKFINDILKSKIQQLIIELASARENTSLAKQLKGAKTRKILGIEKLEDANDAGTKKSKNCTLILTEGDSAKSLAMAGVEVIGRDSYGVFPLRGKFLNVREAPMKQIKENIEVQHMIKILGLEAGKVYENLDDLRYGSIMIMTDQDTDGSHIKGLLINFIHHMWPSLFKMDGFLKEFITPIIKVKKKTGNQETKSFFSLGDFKAWQENEPVDLKYWNVKYYKGLGTSTNQEAIDYFQNLQRHKILFKYEDEVDDEKIKLCFSRDKIQDRKNWLANYNPELNVDHNRSTLRYRDFVDQELIHFSNADNIRSIPSICDGFKPGQRKILFACFKRNLKAEIKVAQLAGYVAEHSAYHHGEQSLASTIIGMAQNFVGSNNINLLQPIGQFGTRNQGGKDHASARYLFTNLSRVTRQIFPEDDDHSLKFLDDDNIVVEPQWYLPILPMVLVNGAEGIGTGWSTNVPQYNPRDIIKNLKRKLNGMNMEEMMPWYKGFQGEIVETTKNNAQNKSFICRGILNSINEEADLYEIIELPINCWTRAYKSTLEEMQQETKKDKEENKKEDSIKIVDLKEYHTQNRVNFQIQFSPGVIEGWQKSNSLEKNLKLTSNFQTSNLVLFDKDCKIKKYNSVVQIMEEFYTLRLEYYQKRKDFLISRLQRETEILRNKKLFIQLIIDDKISIKNVKKKDLVKSLLTNGLQPMNKITNIKSTKLTAFRLQTDDQKNELEEEEEELQQQIKNNNQPHIQEVPASQFHYLLSMSIWVLTYEQIIKLENEFKTKIQELEDLKLKPIQKMWSEDLDQFEITLKQVEEQEEADRLRAIKEGKNTDRGKAKQPVKPKKQKVNTNKIIDENDQSKDQIKKNNKKIADKENQSSEANKKKNKKKINDSSDAASSSNDDYDDEEFSVNEKKNKEVKKPKKNLMVIESDEESRAQQQVQPIKKQQNIEELPLEERLKLKYQSKHFFERKILKKKIIVNTESTNKPNYQQAVSKKKPKIEEKIDQSKFDPRNHKKQQVRKKKKKDDYLDFLDSDESEEEISLHSDDSFNPSQQLHEGVEEDEELEEQSEFEFSKNKKLVSKRTRRGQENVNDEGAPKNDRKFLKIVEPQYQNSNEDDDGSEYQF